MILEYNHYHTEDFVRRSKKLFIASDAVALANGRKGKKYFSFLLIIYFLIKGFGIALINENTSFHMLKLTDTNLKTAKEMADHVISVVDCPRREYADVLKSKVRGFLSGC